MIEQINNFANFNLAAILFAVIGGGVFIAVFHYALLPILNIILIKPLVSVVYNATLERDSFDNKLDFTSDLVAYAWKNEPKSSIFLKIT